MATVYIYKRAEFNNYHSGGGVVVIANTPEERDALVAQKATGDYAELIGVGELSSSYNLPDGLEVPAEIHLFPNAGCC